MFENIGSKIKGLAKLITVLGIIGSVIAFFVFLYYEDIVTGTIVLVAGILVSWVGSFFLYAYGDLVDNTEKTVKLTKTLISNTKSIISLLSENNVLKVNSSELVGITDSASDADESSLKIDNNKHGSVPISNVNNMDVWECSNCGKFNAKASLFCTNCGKKTK